MLIYDLDLRALEDLVVDRGAPPYRARQIWAGLYKRLYSHWGEFTDLPLQLRDDLEREFALEPLQSATRLASSDGKTEKTAFRLADGTQIETVAMHYARRVTLCISTQAGCAMGCVFCATGQMGFRRHLSSGEIVAQVIQYARRLAQGGHRLTNVVLMGMGEPFHNYESTMRAIDRLNDPQGFNFGARRFTISTVGLVPMIRRFADEKRQVNLAVSLHASDNAARSRMLPINRKYDIEELVEACRYYVQRTGRRISFEWALIEGENDSVEDARALASLLEGLLCHVNAIPLNPTLRYGGKSTSGARAHAFKAALEEEGIRCTLRVRRGIEIAAGCGQLCVV